VDLFFTQKDHFFSFFLPRQNFENCTFLLFFRITSFLRLRLEEVWSPNKRCHKLCATFYVLKLLSLFASCLLSYLFLCFSLSKRNSKMNNIHDFVWLIISTERKHIWGCFLFHFSFLKGFQVLVQPYLLFFPVLWDEDLARGESERGWRLKLKEYSFPLQLVLVLTTKHAIFSVYFVTVLVRLLTTTLDD